MAHHKNRGEGTYTVAGYVRVSTESQLENYSIEEQAARIKAFCAAKGWRLLKIYTDGGYSGGNTDRPALQQLLRDIRASGIDAVVVDKLDRLSRSQKDTLTLIEDGMLARHTDFVSINENFDTSSPFGRAMIGILSAFAQFDKDQITERFTMGRIGRGKAGFYHGGATAPTGYRYENGKLEVDEYGASLVREIYAAFLAGKSINAIWRHAQANYAGKWSAAKIRYILMNSVYIGKVKFAGVEYPGAHSPIIGMETFEAAQQLLGSFDRENRKTSAQKTPFRAGYLLSSLIVCGSCGAKYSANHGYYKCYSRAKSSPKFITDPGCKNENWEIPVLDALIVSEIRELLENPGVLNKLLSSAAGKAPRPDTKKLARRIAEIDKQLERAVDLYQIEGAPIEIIAGRIHALDLERRRLSAELEAGTKDKAPRTEQFLRAAADFSQHFDSSPLETRRQLVSSLVEAIEINGKTFKITWRL